MIVGAVSAGTGNAPPVELYELVLNEVAVTGYAADADDTALAFSYAKGTQTIREQNKDGSADEGETVTFDLATLTAK